MNLFAIFSKTGKGVQEASGKTSQLSRADRAVLSAIDGKTTLNEVQKHFEKLAGPKFEALIQQLDKDGYIREVSSGAAAAPSARPSAPASRAAPPPPPSSSSDDDMDFTQALKLPPRAPAAAAPKAPPVDLAAAARAGADRKAQEDLTLDYRARQELQAKMKVEADAKAKADAKARVEAEARAKAAAEARTAAEQKAASEARTAAMAKLAAEEKSAAEAKSRAEADSKMRAEADAKVKAAREAAVRMATEAKAKAEADAKAKSEAAERDKARLEAELNAKLDAERKAREDAERRASAAAETARKEMEEKAKRDAEELRQKLEAEMKAKLDAERKAREEEDRKRREEEDRRRKEEDERRAKEDAERRAREEADRKKREDEDRKRREDDERRRREDDERRAKEDAERKKREEDDRKKREEEDRRRKEDEARRAKEEAERRAKEEAERKAKDDAERKAKDDAERKAKDDAERRALEDTNRRLETERRAKEEAERKAEAERRAREEAEAKAAAERRAKEEAERKAEAERRAKEEAEAKARAAATTATSLPKIEAVAPPPPPPPPAAAAGGGFGDSLLADLDSFGKREEEEQKAKEEAERKAKEEKARREKEEAERKAKEEADKKRREEEERRRKEEEERRAREEAERKELEEEARRKEEEAERKRKAKEALAAKQAEDRAARAAAAGGKAAAGDDDIGVTDEDLDMDDLKRDQKVAAEKARKVAREQPAVAASSGRPKKWGKPAAVALFALLVVGVGVLHVMPLSTAEYEKAASEAMGVPVKIGSARLSVITGIEVKLEGVSIGDAVKIRMVRGTPEVGSLFGARKSFNRVDLEGVSITQSQIAGALLGKVAGENLRIARIGAKQLVLDGPLKLPPLDMEAAVAGDGSLQTVKLSGADKLNVTLSPRSGEIGFEISAGSLAVPFVPALSLSDFAMKGSANSAGVTNSEFDGRVFDGVIKGSARIRWGASWSVEGELRANGLKAAVFAPTLVSDGRVEGRAAYSMTGSAPATLYESARLQGEFKIEKGVIGSFDLARALQTGGASTGGRTIFNELTGQGLYDKGVVQISNASISAGAMNAGLSLNIDAGGGLSGRVVADVKTPSQTLRSNLNISGKVQDPVIRK